MTSDILISCGHTFSQLPHPRHADGRLSSGIWDTIIGAMNPKRPADVVKTCSLYREMSFGIYIHIDFSEHRLDYKGQPSEIVIGEPKNRKHRLIPITKEIRELLARIKKASPSKDSEFLFVDKNGGRYTAAKISGAVRRHFRAIGVEKGSVHRIRRTVSSLLNHILPQKDVSALLGHTETVNDMFYNYSTANMSEKAHALTDLRKLLHDKGNTESA